MDQTEDEHHTWDDELGEPVDGLPMVDAATGKKILRPRNAWILYRNAHLEKVARLPDGSRQPMAEASKVISRWWKAETREIRATYEAQAEREKAEHRHKYPHYKFQPKSKQQKQREQAAKKEAKKKTQLANKKGRTRGLTPPTFSSTQTSYMAAAWANQTAKLAPTLAPPTLSPPLSLASTPLSGPSPLSSSDLEYSTSATSPMSASPSSAMGLGLLPSMTFSGQETANARVPQRTPARLPPRSKGQRYSSGSSSASRVPSSATVTPPTPPASSPAPSASHMLSPLPWPPVPQQPSPEPDGNSPPALSMAQDDPPFDAWLNEGAYEAVPDTTGPTAIELSFPQSFDISQFTDAFDLPPLDATDSQGVYQLPADSFLESAPGQIDVSLGAMEPAGVSSETSEAFTDLIHTLDWAALFQTPPDVNEPSASGHTSFSDTNNDRWKDFRDEDPSLLQNILSGNDLLKSYEENETRKLEEDYLAGGYVPTTADSQPQAQSQPPQTQALHTNIAPQPSYASPAPPEELAQNPLFRDWYSSCFGSQSVPQAQSRPVPVQNTYQQSYAQAGPSSHREASSSFQPPPPPPPPQHSYSTPNSTPPPSTFTSAKTTYAPPSTNTFVPPPGANRTRERRVAGSWRPPIPHQQSNAWSAPVTPGSIPAQKIPSWGSS